MTDTTNNRDAPDFEAEVRGRIAALAAFEDAMRQASEDYAKAPALTDRRGAAVAALTAVHRLMDKIDMIWCVGPIFEIAAAICAVDKGTVLPLLRVGPRPDHAPSISDSVWMQRAVVAASLDQRFRVTNDGLQAAAAEVARWLVGLAIIGNTENPRAAILKWREEMNARRSDELPKMIFDHYLRPSVRTIGEYMVPLANRDALRRELEIWGIGKTPITPDLMGTDGS